MSVNTQAEYDLVCVGSGAAGLTAAIRAHEAGLSVLVIEKSSKIGGVASISGGQVWVPMNHLAQEEGIEDSIEEAVAYLMWIGGGIGDEARARHYCTYASEAVRFLADHANVDWQLVPGADDYHGHPESLHSRGRGRLLSAALFSGSSLGEAQSYTRHGPEVTSVVEVYSDVPEEEELERRRQNDERGHGGALLGSLVKNALERGITFWRNARATRLLTTDGRVTGVGIDHDGTDVEVSARAGVLLATGGYDSSLEFRTNFDTEHTVSTSSLPSVTGDHFRLAGRLGARVATPFRLPHNFLVPKVPVVLNEDGVTVQEANLAHSASAHAMVVNRRGKRFHDETTSASRDAGTFVIDVHEPWKWANYPCWSVWDSQHNALFEITPEALAQPGVITAPTLKELAVKAGIDPDGLEAEVARFNEHCALGHDRDFNRGSPNTGHIRGGGGRPGGPTPALGTIEKGPFYAVELYQRTIGVPHAGLVNDEHSRVLDWDNEPIEGLYAAGGSAALLEFGWNYTGGNANARSLLQGYRAGCHVVSTAGKS